MNNLNSVLLEGNLTKDPGLTETPKGTPVCVFSLAVNRFYRQDDNTVKEVSYFDIETWSRLAQFCSGQLKKGSPVRVVGHLKQERWEDAEGKYHSRIKVVAEHVEVTEKKQAAGDFMVQEVTEDMVDETGEEITEGVPVGAAVSETEQAVMV